MGYLQRKFEVHQPRDNLGRKMMPITGLQMEPFCRLIDGVLHVDGGEFSANDPCRYDPAKGNKGDFFTDLEQNDPSHLLTINTCVLFAAAPHIRNIHAYSKRPLLSINFSPSDFLDPDFLRKLWEARRDLRPDQIGLEITEPRRKYSNVDITTIRNTVQLSSGLGFRVGLDDVPEDFKKDFRLILAPFISFIKFDADVSQKTLAHQGTNLSKETKVLITAMRRKKAPIVFEGIKTAKDLADINNLFGIDALVQSWGITNAERRSKPRAPKSSNDSQFGGLNAAL